MLGGFNEVVQDTLFHNHPIQNTSCPLLLFSFSVTFNAVWHLKMCACVCVCMYTCVHINNMCRVYSLLFLPLLQHKVQEGRWISLFYFLIDPKYLEGSQVHSRCSVKILWMKVEPLTHSKHSVTAAVTCLLLFLKSCLNCIPSSSVFHNAEPTPFL